MPRLFTSHRAAPLDPKAPALQLKRKLPVATLQELQQQSPSPPAGDEPPLVLVPSLPKSLTRLMDSHDLDNPYLVAAFNVIMDNDNNPMRVPDILHAVQQRGWTQVLHRHKDRPEQLFGNALRAHQRRRELMGKPSLVFMIDAGGCWKHHEIDLSGASGRKKGKIWCFSQEAGFPCPYARLGMDLDAIRAAQYPPGSGPDGASSHSETTSKKRKADSDDEDHYGTNAVRGDVSSVHSVVKRPPPHIPAAVARRQSSSSASSISQTQKASLVVPRPSYLSTTSHSHVSPSTLSSPQILPLSSDRRRSSLMETDSLDDDSMLETQSDHDGDADSSDFTFSVARTPSPQPMYFTDDYGFVSEDPFHPVEISMVDDNLWSWDAEGIAVDESGRPSFAEFLDTKEKSASSLDWLSEDLAIPYPSLDPPSLYFDSALSVVQQTRDLQSTPEKPSDVAAVDPSKTMTEAQPSDALDEIVEWGNEVTREPMVLESLSPCDTVISSPPSPF